ncbi:MAG: bifunctional diaminohydroxyphosphoribosylaminopyrimidine deaminase/5-amino-6-(5-phosphoribosylamino)uracil reductase RibD [Acidimicrobiia bacterium]
MIATTDDELMAEAVEAAHAAPAVAPPWPRVGCVVVHDGEIVGRGATGPYPVGPHAEVAALRDAGDRARGATVYTTLEPCDHDGNTPPCTRALLDAGVVRVVVGVVDPDVKVAGRGLDRLRSAGVAVSVGAAAGVVEDDLAPYLHHRRTGRAFTILKTAMSLDGRTSAADGTSQWITGPEARADVHRLRAESQAIVVGPATARIDQPSLTVRDAPLAVWGQPLRVVLDPRGRVPVAGPLADQRLADTLVVTTERMDPAVLDAWHAAGAKTVLVGPGPEGRGVDLEATLRLLAAEHDVYQAMVEGGGRLHGAFVAEGHADRIVTYVAPLVLGEQGRAVIATPGAATLVAADRGWQITDVTPFGPDVRITYSRVPTPATGTGA